ncbi:MAG TPA: pantetheine-phosphate adenylyltransferase [Candidatus Saccharimonadales bacterium]|nr:pantetheine-phosphate adenylyltransferase [Candidatus Saccharimonadales bacterium]
MQYKLVVCGGTFDHFHQGHEAFLQAALAVSNQVLIGITSDIYIHQRKPGISQMQTFIQRKKAVEKFLSDIHASERVTIAPIDTVLYPKEWETLPIEAIISTEETKKGAEAINYDRQQKGLSALDIFIIPFIPDDKGEKIASTNIREGKINNQGISYIQPSWFTEDVLLPEIEKQWFKKPFGELHRDNTFLTNEDPQKVVTVGDVVTQDCNTLSFKQKLSIIDFVVQRKGTFHKIQELGFSGREKTFYVDNLASTLTLDLVRNIIHAISLFPEEKQVIIVVHGEEDLAVIPLVLALPLGFIIVYGQPNQGIVRLAVTTEAKNRAYSLLKRFVSQK